MQYLAREHVTFLEKNEKDMLIWIISEKKVADFFHKVKRVMQIYNFTWFSG